MKEILNRIPSAMDDVYFHYMKNKTRGLSLARQDPERRFLERRLRELTD
jgi:hypothetical protein